MVFCGVVVGACGDSGSGGAGSDSGSGATSDGGDGSGAGDSGASDTGGTQSSTTGSATDGTDTTSGGDSGDGDWAVISASWGLSCGVKLDGTLWCWGDTDDYAIGGWLRCADEPVQIGTATDWSDVEAGPSHGCAIKQDQSLWCWGANDRGQSGIGMSGPPVEPTHIAAGTRFESVSLGLYHGCGIADDSTLWCWGDGNSGALGTGTTDDQWAPVQIGTDADWRLVEASGSHTCAIKDDDTLWCWGRNADGSLGDGTTDDRLAPVQVGNDDDWASVSGGSVLGSEAHTCGTKLDGTGLCWGGNSKGQLGDGTMDPSLTPIEVQGGPWQYLSIGQGRSCGLAEDGTVWCWGTRLALDEPDVPYPDPAQVGSDDDWVQLDVENHACARKGDGTAWCWGGFNIGQVGDRTAGDDNFRPLPTLVGSFGGDPPAAAWKAFATGISVSCGIQADDSLWCWGSNRNGELGEGTVGGLGCTQTPATAPCDRTSPWPVMGTDTWAGVYSGGSFVCALHSSGRLYCWGNGESGAIGDGLAADTGTPTQVGARDDWARVSAGDEHVCAIAGDGTLWCWGGNLRGQIGNGTGGSDMDVLTPVQIGTENDWESISAGDSTTCGLRAGGQRWCWGINSNGQYGDGTTTDSNVPSRADTDDDWVLVSTAWLHTCGIKQDGSLWCWGEAGEAGLGVPYTVMQHLSPVRVGTDNDWAEVRARRAGACARKQDGSLWCWGRNSSGEVGNGIISMDDVWEPERIGTDTDWTVLDTAPIGSTTCGLRNDGSIHCWGASGALRGDNRTCAVGTPAPVQRGALP